MEHHEEQVRLLGEAVLQQDDHVANEDVILGHGLHGLFLQPVDEHSRCVGNHGLAIELEEMHVS